MNSLPVMQITDVAASVSGLLTPLLPYLIKFGKEAWDKSLEEIGTKIGEQGWERAKGLWAKLNPWLTHSDEANEKMAELANDVEIAESAGKVNDIEKVANAFEFDIKRLLKSNPDLAREISELIKETQDNLNDGAVFNVRNQFAEQIYNIGKVNNFYAK